MSPDQLPERIANKITTDDLTRCWVWNAATRPDGYGVARFNRRMTSAHRLTYHLLVDPTFPLHVTDDDQRQIDHICRNRPCVNPEHLQPVTFRFNTILGRKCLLNKGSSAFIGVHLVRGTRWVAAANHAGVRTYLGTFDTEREAAAAYDDFVDSVGEGRPNKDLGLFDQGAAA